MITRAARKHIGKKVCNSMNAGIILYMTVLAYCAGCNKGEVNMPIQDGARAGNHRAPHPPMGWNTSGSYNLAGETEDMIKRGAEAMIATGLTRAGYDIVLIDYGWYMPSADLRSLIHDKLSPAWCDAFGRLIPYPDRYPSAANGQGFKPLADFLHDRGMKLGLHIMRGVYRAAWEANLPVKGTPYHARDIADTNSTCGWSTLMYGLNMNHPGAQPYLDSLMELYGQWGVDFLKIDDLLSPYHAAEIAGYNRARSKAGRPIIISSSAGNDTPLEQSMHLRQNTDMFRITRDQWDNWSDILVQFERAPQWAPFCGDGAWADLDALPFGWIFDMVDSQQPIPCRLTRDEVRTSMTLHCISRSPLVFYADPLRLDDFTKAILTNPDALDANRNGTGQHEFASADNLRKWISTRQGTRSRYLALFNLADKPAQVDQPLAEAGMAGPCRIRDIWANVDFDCNADSFPSTLPAHGVGFYRLDPK